MFGFFFPKEQTQHPLPGSYYWRMVKFPKSSIHTKTHFTKPPPKLHKSFIKIDSKTLQPEEGLLLKSHVMLRNSSSAEINVGSHENGHYNFSAYFINQSSTGLWAATQTPIAEIHLGITHRHSCPWARLSLQNMSLGVEGCISVSAPPMLSCLTFH